MARNRRRLWCSVVNAGDAGNVRSSPCLCCASSSVFDRNHAAKDDTIGLLKEYLWLENCWQRPFVVEMIGLRSEILVA